MPPRIAVTSTHTEKMADAKALAIQLQLPFMDKEYKNGPHAYDYLLVLTPDYLGLVSRADKKPFYIDFLSEKLNYRVNQAGLRKEALARAISLSPHHHPTIIDATAGLGRDSYILATLGYNVIMLERSAILHALLADALKRASHHIHTAPVIARLQLIHADALFWLSEHGHPHLNPTVVYLDPMFPARKKSASVKKEMVILQDLLGTDKDEDRLFELSIACATHRVVVKRPRLANNIVTQPKPSYSIVGQSSRFDIYLIQKNS